MMASGQGTSSSACAACRVLRRKCTAQCLFAPYFPPDQPQKFAHVHKVFGVANVTKMLHELPPPHREDCVNSLAYEADARVQDPVYGCVGSISVLQHQRMLNEGGASQVAHLQAQLALATSEITRLRETLAIAASTASPSTNNRASATAGAAAPGGLLMAALVPCSSPMQEDLTSVNSVAAATAAAVATPDELPQQQPQRHASSSIMSLQPTNPISCEHFPPLLLL